LAVEVGWDRVGVVGVGGVGRGLGWAWGRHGQPPGARERSSAPMRIRGPEMRLRARSCHFRATTEAYSGCLGALGALPGTR